MTSKDLKNLRNALEKEIRFIEIQPDKDTDLLLTKIKTLENVRKHMEAKSR